MELGPIKIPEDYNRPEIAPESKGLRKCLYCGSLCKLSKTKCPNCGAPKQ